MTVSDELFYLYCIVEDGTGAPDGVGVVEPSAGPARAVTGRRVAAIASPLAEEPVHLTRRNLESHQAVVEAAFGSGTVLPCRFGLVVPGLAALHDLLDEEGQRWARLLDRFEGLAEVRVTARYVDDAGLREAMAADPRLLRMRQRISGRPADATYYHRIELGEAVAGVLGRLRGEAADRLSARLRRTALAERRLEQKGTDVVLRSAYLVRRSRLGALDGVVRDIASDMDGRMAVEAVGPLAPWDFVELDELNKVARPRRIRSRAGT